MDVQGPQLKFKDVYYNQLLAGGTPHVFYYAPSYIAQGTATNQRIGDEIFIHRIAWRFFAHPRSVANDSTHFWCDPFRVLLVLDTQKNPSEPKPAFDDIMDSDSFLAFPKFNVQQRYRILYDEQFVYPTPQISWRFSNVDQVTGAVSGDNQYGIGVATEDYDETLDPPLPYPFASSAVHSESGHALFLLVYSDGDMLFEVDMNVYYSDH